VGSQENFQIWEKINAINRQEDRAGESCHAILVSLKNESSAMTGSSNASAIPSTKIARLPNNNADLVTSR